MEQNDEILESLRAELRVRRDELEELRSRKNTPASIISRVEELIAELENIISRWDEEE